MFKEEIFKLRGSSKRDLRTASQLADAKSNSTSVEGLNGIES